MEFKILLKELMNKNNFNLTKLSKMSGISKPLISNYLSGGYKPKINNLYKLADTLNVNVETLIKSVTN